MSLISPRGLVYRCPICQSEIVVLARRHGAFEPVCCNTVMVARERRVPFYRCPICGSEVAVWIAGNVNFTPRCCNERMRREENVSRHAA